MSWAFFITSTSLGHQISCTHRPHKKTFLPCTSTNSSPRRPHQSTTTKSKTALLSSSKHERRVENVPGDVFVDSSCIDCDTCRWFCPSVFHRDNGMSAVYSQPTDDTTKHQALQAAVACPTGSIRTSIPQKDELQKALNSFPSPVIDAWTDEPITNIYYNGYTSPKTFAASSWLLQLTNPKLNVMIDCPRYSSRLAERIEAMGGLDFLVLSHSDDVEGHDEWKKRFPGLQRIIHTDEVSKFQGTNECEIQLTDSELHVQTNDIISEQIKIIHVPGHTKGSIAVLHGESKTLFSGDHCWGDGAKGEVTASNRFCFYSFQKQMENIKMLAEYDILHVLPGHGRPLHFQSVEQGKKAFLEAPQQIQGRSQ